jgi:acyl carrier protein
MRNDSTVEQSVRAAMSTVLGRHIGPDEDVTRENEPWWDSLHHVELIFSVEDACDVRFDEEELSELSSFRDIVDSVDCKRAS